MTQIFHSWDIGACPVTMDCIVVMLFNVRGTTTCECNAKGCIENNTCLKRRKTLEPLFRDKPHVQSVSFSTRWRTTTASSRTAAAATGMIAAHRAAAAKTHEWQAYTKTYSYVVQQRTVYLFERSGHRIHNSDFIPSDFAISDCFAFWLPCIIAIFLILLFHLQCRCARTTVCTTQNN